MGTVHARLPMPLDGDVAGPTVSLADGMGETAAS